MDDRDEAALDALIDGLAQTEREVYEKGLGEGLLAAVDGITERREAENRALLDVLHRSREAEDTE